MTLKNERVAECLGTEIPDIDKSLWDIFATAAEKHPNEEAVCSLWQPWNRLQSPSVSEGEDTETACRLPKDIGNSAEPVWPDHPLRWTYSELKQKAELLASWLHNHGCTRGGNLVVCASNSAEWALTLWTSARLGMTFVPLDPNYLSADAQHYFEIAQPHVVFLDKAMLPAPTVFENARICISLSTALPGASTDWYLLHEIMQTPLLGLESFIPREDESLAKKEELAMILFTSGTTSLPKGCLHTSANIWSQTFDYDPVAREKGQQNKWLIHTPVCHIFALGQAIRGWRDGSSVVFPAAKFDVTASLRALQQERITHMGAVPALVHALIGHPQFPGKDGLNLKYVSMGGTLITNDDIQLCKDRIGSQAVIQGFGMTEGSPVASWRRDDPLLEHGHHAGVGKVLPGARMRICAPDSQRPLNRGEIGELHIGGTSIIDSYANVVDDAFYTDNLGRWFATGDQAIIDQDDVLHINGRYKDIIIRGGENLVPLKIEHCLAKLGVVSHVVGISDPISGEAPIAVVQKNSNQITNAVMNKSVVESLGSKYALQSFVTLDELQLQQPPMTATGKIRKHELKEIANAFWASKRRRDSSNDIQKENIVSQLREIWAEFMKLEPQEVSVTEPISDLVDSITLLQVCESVWSKLGKKLYLPDLIYEKSIQQQAKLMSRREERRKPSQIEQEAVVVTETRSTDSWKGLLSATIIGIDRSVNRLLKATAEAVKGVGLTLDDAVESFLPVRDISQEFVRGQRTQTYRHRIAFEINGRSPSEVRSALEQTLSSRPILRTIMVEVPDEAAIHVVLRPTPVVYSNLIKEGPLLTQAEVQALIFDESDESFDKTRMFGAVVARLNSDTTVLIITLSHSIFDAIFAYAWYRDLDRLLVNPIAPIRPGTPFKLFTDLYQQYRGSLLASSDVNFHVKRLRGISRLSKAHWPAQRAPGWMTGNDEGSKYSSTRAEARAKLNPKSRHRAHLVRSNNFPDLKRLKSETSIQTSTIVKTAISLFNIEMTGQRHAIFRNFDANRTWPILDEWNNILPSTMSIDGPTMSLTMNMIEIVPSETCGKLLERMQHDQQELSRHAHAPWFSIIDQLCEEGPIVRDSSKRQAFNWDLSVRYRYSDVKDYEILNPIGRMDWPDCGFFWNCGLLDAERLCCAVLWDEAHVDSSMVGTYVDDMFQILEWIVKPENWKNPISMLPGFPNMA